MFSVREETNIEAYIDQKGKKIPILHIYFSVCSGDFCFYFSDSKSAYKFCSMLNWLIDSNRRDEISRVKEFFDSKNIEAFNDITSLLYTEQEQEQEQGSHPS